MAQKKRRKKKRKPSAAARRAREESENLGVSRAPREESGGGVMQSIRTGFQRAAGAGEASEEKPSTASNVIWGIVLLGAVAFLLYRWYG